MPTRSPDSAQRGEYVPPDMADHVYRARKPHSSPLWQHMQTALDLPDGLPGIVMCIHTFGEYLDFHPHLHALVADGLFTRAGLFHVMPDVDLQPLEELFRARIITFRMEKGLLPPARAQMLRTWVHSGFNVFRSRRVAPEERADLERLAQYIIRNPFAVEKMQVTDANRANPDGSIIYHSDLNPKIQRNFEVFTPCELIAAITQHIPDQSFQLVRCRVDRRAHRNRTHPAPPRPMATRCPGCNRPRPAGRLGHRTLPR